MKKKLIMIVFVFLFSSLSGFSAKAAQEDKWKEESIYFLMVDRFNNGDSSNDGDKNALDPKAYHGGDFQGIMDKLDYIQKMGFTTIALTPIFDNQEKGYHGYWINDFYETDEHFGSIETFKKLVKEVHKRDMKIMLDFVVNNVASTHPWLNDPEKKDWFHEKKLITNWNNQTELEEGWVNGLPDLNQSNPETRKYLMDVAKWWITETDIDGYRLDTVQHVPVDFWEEFSSEVKKVKPDFYLLGDVRTSEAASMAKYDKEGIDGFVDYPLQDQLRSAFSKTDQTLNVLLANWKRNESFYEEPFLMGNMMDNHNTLRFTREIVQNKQNPATRWKLALTYLFTTPGIPMAYYGSEIALDGGSDPDNRRDMSFRADKELIDYMTKLGELRKELRSLRKGTLKVLYEKDGMGIYKREYKGETAVIALNNTSKSQRVILTDEHLKGDMELRGLLADDNVKSKDGQYEIIIDREKAEIYVLAEKTGLNIPYLVAMAVVYVVFFYFIYLIWKRSKKKKAE